MAVYVPNARQQFFNGNVPLASGSVGMYVPGTLTSSNTWQDAAQTTLNANPIPLDLNGSAMIYGIGQYRQIVKDSLGNTIWDRVITLGLEPNITPESYGAIGDGVNDDTASVQAAINAAVGKRLVLANIYAVSNLTIPSNSTIGGVGTIKRKTAATGYLIYGNNATNVTLLDFTVDANNTGDANQHIRFEGASDDITIENLTVKNGVHDAIAVSGTSSRARISRNRTFSCRVGIVVDASGGNHHIHDNYCRSNTASGIIVSAPNTVVTGNKCYSNGTGLTQQGGILMLTCASPVVSDNQVANNGTGAFFSHGIQFNTCTDAVATGNHSSGNNGSGLDFYISTGCTCTGNKALNNKLRGIEVDSGASDTVVVGNTVKGNYGAGISVFNTLNAIVDANIIVGNGTLGTATNPLTGLANEPYGLALWGAGSYANFAVVSNNGMNANIGSGSNGIGLFIDPSCTNVTLTGNRFTGNTSNATVASGNISYAMNNQGLYFNQFGSATITSGNTSVAITFPQVMSITPSAAQVILTALNTATNAPGELYPTSVTASGMTINCRSNPGASNLSVGWRVLCGT